MATYLDCVNGVLLRMRESTVSTVIQSDYSYLIGAMVNETKREIEDAWNWSILRTTKTINTVNGTQNYAITGTSSRTRLLKVYIPTLKRDLEQASQDQMHAWVNMQGTVTGGPQYFSIGNSNTSDEITLDLWPIPDQAYAVKVDCVVPQANLVNDLDVVYVPSELVIQGAYLRAINERGEDQGRLSDQQNDLYRKAVATYIAIESARYEDEITWNWV